MAIINKYTELDLDNATYTQVDLGTAHNFFLIGINDNNVDISSATFAVAIDSGVTGKPLFLQNIQVPFTGEINGVRYTGFPEKFFMKPLQIINKNGDVIKTGEIDVAININPVVLE